MIANTCDEETPHLQRFEATEKMGYKPFMLPAATISESYTNPDGETINGCEYCGFCERFGCEYGAKASPEVTVVPTALKQAILKHVLMRMSSRY